MRSRQWHLERDLAVKAILWHGNTIDGFERDFYSAWANTVPNPLAVAFIVCKFYARDKNMSSLYFRRPKLKWLERYKSRNNAFSFNILLRLWSKHHYDGKSISK